MFFLGYRRWELPSAITLGLSQFLSRQVPPPWVCHSSSHSLIHSLAQPALLLSVFSLVLEDN